METGTKESVFSHLKRGKERWDGGLKNPCVYVYWCTMQQSQKYVVSKEGLDIKIREYKTDFFLALIVKREGQNTDNQQSTIKVTESSFMSFAEVILWAFFSIMMCTSPLRATSRTIRFQTAGDSGRLFLVSTLPRQPLHEAAGHRGDDDNADKQGG